MQYIKTPAAALWCEINAKRTEWSLDSVHSPLQDGTPDLWFTTSLRGLAGIHGFAGVWNSAGFYFIIMAMMITVDVSYEWCDGDDNYT